MASMTWNCNLEDDDLERLELPELDGALLMEFLEESDADEAKDDRLRFVMRSLEAGISPKMISDGGSTTGPHDDSEGGGLEDMLSDFDSCDGSRSPAYLVEDPFDLVDMEVGDGMGGWCMEVGTGEGGIVGHGEPGGGFYEGEGTMEQVYSPLWLSI